MRTGLIATRREFLSSASALAAVALLPGGLRAQHGSSRRSES